MIKLKVISTSTNRKGNFKTINRSKIEMMKVILML